MAALPGARRLDCEWPLSLLQRTSLKPENPKPEKENQNSIARAAQCIHRETVNTTVTNRRELQNIAREILVLDDLVEAPMNVRGIDHQLAIGQLGRVERQLFEQPLEDSMQSARANIFRARVALGRDLRERRHAVLAEAHMHAL